MRQIETDLRSPLAPQAPLTPTRFDAEQYFAEGGAAEADPEPRPLTIYRRSSPRELAAGVEGPEIQSPIEGEQVASPSMEGFGQALGNIGEGVNQLYKTPPLSPAYTAGQGARRDLTPAMMAARLNPEAQGAESPSFEDVGKVMADLAHDPVGLVAGMLPVIGNAYAAKDTAKLSSIAERLRASGDTESADDVTKLLPIASAGIGMPIAAGAATRPLVKTAEKIAARAAERSALEGVEKAVEGGVKQAISSADTSIKQVPALFKSKYFDAPEGSRNLDIGGGKYDLGSDYLRNERGVESQVYDPFNRSSEHNEMVLNAFKDNPADTVTAANVLNVIAEPEARAEVIQQAFDNLKPGGKAHFDVYEGDRSGAGRETSKGWQNNMKAQDFLEEVRSVFPNAERKGTTIIATKPAVEGVELGAAKAAEETAAPAMQAAADAATQPLYRPVVDAYHDMPEPAAVRTQAVDHITESINSTDGEAAKLPTKQGLGPMYIVDSGAEKVSKKSGFMLNDTKNANAARQLDGITPLFQEFPEMGTNPEQWAQGMSKAFGSKEVVAPPYRFMKALESGEYTDLLKTLTPGQIADADAGFAAGKDFLRAYHAGEMGVEDTGKLFMWGIMSRGVNPFTHEGLFLDAFQGIEPYIKMAADGKFTKEVATGPYKEWAATTAGKGSGQPGAGAMHNLNAFGKDFLVKMGRPGADGVTPMQKLHDLMSNPDMTGRDIRREFAKVGEGVGIDNKVVSFILLATGRDDVMVIDRIQLKNLWDDGRYADMNIWDGISVPTVKMKDGTTKRFPPTDEGRAAAKDFAKQNKGAKGGTAAVTGSSLAEATYGAKGILVYEALEDALMKNVGKMYQDLGRPEAASPGRFHWETWVARSNQEASHGTLPAILKKVQGSNNPLEGVYSKQGDYQSYAYGAKYGRSAEGQPQFTIPLSTGEEVVMSPEQYSAALDLIRKPKSGVIPSGKGQKFNVTDTVGMPWYEREGVNRAKLDDIIRQAAAGQASPVRKADGGSVSDRSGSSAAGRGAGSSGQRGSAFRTIDEQVTAVASDLASIARKDHLDQRHLAYLLKVASGMYMPPERAMEFAGQIMLGDAEGLISRFKTYRPSIRTFARLNQMMGGKHQFMSGDHMGGAMMRMKGEEALMRTKENAESVMDSDVVKSRPAMKKALEAFNKRI
jgi:hypothetical protein